MNVFVEIVGVLIRQRKGLAQQAVDLGEGMVEPKIRR